MASGRSFAGASSSNFSSTESVETQDQKDQLQLVLTSNFAQVALSLGEAFEASFFKKILTNRRSTKTKWALAETMAWFRAILGESQHLGTRFGHQYGVLKLR